MEGAAADTFDTLPVLLVVLREENGYLGIIPAISCMFPFENITVNSPENSAIGFLQCFPLILPLLEPEIEISRTLSQ